MSDYATFVVEPDGSVSAWMRSSPHGAMVKLTPITSWRLACDCGECMGWAVVDAEDLRREKDMAARREAA